MRSKIKNKQALIKQNRKNTMKKVLEMKMVIMQRNTVGH
jgi:hypothetical protein